MVILDKDKKPSGFVSLTLRLLIHPSHPTNTSINIPHETNERGSFEHPATPILPTDQVEIRIQTIGCHDLKDVEMGFLGIKKADDQNDVYLKLTLGTWGEVQTDVRDNAGAVASYDYQVRDHTIDEHSFGVQSFMTLAPPPPSYPTTYIFYLFTFTTYITPTYI